MYGTWTILINLSVLKGMKMLIQENLRLKSGMFDSLKVP